jgi:hypothetical protein
MQGAVPVTRTGKQEMSRTLEESEGHSVFGLFGTSGGALARPKKIVTEAYDT